MTREYPALAAAWMSECRQCGGTHYQRLPDFLYRVDVQVRFPYSSAIGWEVEALQQQQGAAPVAASI